MPHPETFRIRDDVGFFQAVRAALSKRATGEARPEEDLDLAVRQIISRAVASEGVLDIFAAAGLDKPDISVLSDEFPGRMCRECLNATSPSNFYRSCSRVSCISGAARTWCRLAPSPR